MTLKQERQIAAEITAHAAGDPEDHFGSLAFELAELVSSPDRYTNEIGHDEVVPVDILGILDAVQRDDAGDELTPDLYKILRLYTWHKAAATSFEALTGVLSEELQRRSIELRNLQDVVAHNARVPRPEEVILDESASDQVLQEMANALMQLSMVGGRVIVRHGPPTEQTEAAADWWKQLRPLMERAEGLGINIRVASTEETS